MHVFSVNILQYNREFDIVSKPVSTILYLLTNLSLFNPLPLDTKLNN